MSETIKDTITKLRKAHRQRCFHMEQRKRLDLATGSFLRMQLGWRKIEKGDPDYEEQSAINKAANEQVEELMTVGEAEFKAIQLSAKAANGALKGHEKVSLRRAEETARTADPAYEEWREDILASLQGRAAFDAREDKATERMRELATTLPVIDWWRENVFDDPLQLAVIVGEAGDLSDYPHEFYPDELPNGDPHPKAGQRRKLSSGASCLWKRMGVAVIGRGDGEDDKRQGGLSKSAGKDEWIEHGYNRKRRSRLFVIGDVLVKQAGHQYREIYLARKEYERKRAEAKGLIVAPSASIPDKRRHEFMSHGHIDKRARRYMEKTLLKQLWKAWRRATVSMAERPAPALPAARPTEERRVA